MKKLFALVLALGVAITIGACGRRPEETAVPADAAAPGEARLGTLSLLNTTEEERLAWAKGDLEGVKYLLDKGALVLNDASEPMPEPGKVTFYDTLDAMVMALLAGDIDYASVPQSTGEYLRAHNDWLEAAASLDLEGADDFSKRVAHRLGVSFSFITTEQNAALRDEVDQAIDRMREDGTLDELVRTHITDAAAIDPDPVEFQEADGGTLRVAVTGSLPPMDYVSADGTPAGFNTALLAELGKRLNRNIELVQVDSIGRAAALSSGLVDLVFWTSGPTRGVMTDEEVAKMKEKDKKELTEEQFKLMEDMDGGIDYQKRQASDLPDGTFRTQAYYSDFTEYIALKK